MSSLVITKSSTQHQIRVHFLKHVLELIILIVAELGYTKIFFSFYSIISIYKEIRKSW